MIWLLLVLVGPTATAQSFTEMGIALQPSGSPSHASQSIGAPSVTWNSIRNEMIMIFESLTTTSYSGCTKGVWALGMAKSADGRPPWTIDSTVVVMPTGTTNHPYACVAAHPTAVFTPNGANGKVQVYWKAESTTGCSGTNCEYSGIGRVIINLDSNGDIDTGDLPDIHSGAVIEFQSNQFGGFPRAIRIEDLGAGTDYFYLALQQYPDIWLFRSTSATAFGPANGQPAGDTIFYPSDSAWSSHSWVRDEFMSPAMICNDTGDIELFVGTRSFTAGSVDNGAIGLAMSEAANGPSYGAGNWDLDANSSITWTGDNTYRHFDVLKLDDGNYLLYYSKKNGSGLSRVHYAATDSGFSLGTGAGDALPLGKVCTIPAP